MKYLASRLGCALGAQSAGRMASGDAWAFGQEVSLVQCGVDVRRSSSPCRTVRAQVYAVYDNVYLRKEEDERGDPAFTLTHLRPPPAAGRAVYGMVLQRWSLLCFCPVLSGSQPCASLGWISRCTMSRTSVPNGFALLPLFFRHSQQRPTVPAALHGHRVRDVRLRLAVRCAGEALLPAEAAVIPSGLVRTLLVIPVRVPCGARCPGQQPPGRRAPRPGLHRCVLHAAGAGHGAKTHARAASGAPRRQAGQPAAQGQPGGPARVDVQAGGWVTAAQKLRRLRLRRCCSTACRFPRMGQHPRGLAY